MCDEPTDDVARVEQSCRSFLQTYFGANGGADSQKDTELRQIGLRLVTLGNPERTVQGELVHYLRSHSLLAVSECGVMNDGTRNSIDIFVFDEKWSAICAIELKHYSANQGRVAALTLGMLRDEVRHQDGPQKDLPLIQIGLYTEITESFNRATSPLPDFGLYRFLRVYFNGLPHQRIEGQIIPPEFEGQLVVPPTTEFDLAGGTVVGRVGWIIRKRRPRAA